MATVDDILAETDSEWVESCYLLCNHVNELILQSCVCLRVYACGLYDVRVCVLNLLRVC